MATKYLKSLTIDGVTNELVIPEQTINSITFNIAAANAPYGGASLTLERGFLYYVLGAVRFTPSTSTAGQTYRVWLANTLTPNNPFVGEVGTYSLYNAGNYLSVSAMVAIPDDAVNPAVGCYANIINTICNGNTMSIMATKIAKMGG